MNEINLHALHTVERCVCEYFGVDYEKTITEQSKSRDSVNARHFIFCILHEVYLYSSKKIADYYGVNIRWVKRATAKIKSYCNIYKEYKKHYDVLTTVLLDAGFSW